MCASQTGWSVCNFVTSCWKHCYENWHCLFLETLTNPKGILQNGMHNMMPWIIPVHFLDESGTCNIQCRGEWDHKLVVSLITCKKTISSFIFDLWNTGKTFFNTIILKDANDYNRTRWRRSNRWVCVQEADLDLLSFALGQDASSPEWKPKQDSLEGSGYTLDSSFK
jgi:hypothetical protein